MDSLIFIYFVVILWIVLCVKAIVEIAKHPYQKQTRKMVWTNIVMIFPFFGLMLYHLIGRRNLKSR